MASRDSVTTDRYGSITGTDRTKDRADGKTETWHLDRYGRVTGKTINDPRTGRSQHYERTGGGPLLGFTFRKR
jgi:hypothetical protein